MCQALTLLLSAQNSPGDSAPVTYILRERRLEVGWHVPHSQRQPPSASKALADPTNMLCCFPLVQVLLSYITGSVS